MKSKLPFLIAFSMTINLYADSDIDQWRGPARDGNFPATNLLKSWPENGPKLLWHTEELGDGYSSATVHDNIVYVSGKIDTVEYLTALSPEGEQLWQLPYGLACQQSYAETRCTPTIENNLIYMISGRGEVVCIDANSQAVKWNKDAYHEFEGAYALWEIAESPLIVDEKVIYTPGGDKTTMIALDKLTGETIWQTTSLHDSTAYVSPVLIERGGKKIIASITRNYLIGVDAANGDILWTHKYSETDPDLFHPEAPFINCVSPIYHDGKLFITSGYNHTSVMFNLSEDGKAISIAWKQPALDTHHGGVVFIDGYIYGSNWINNAQGNWICLDWETGEIKYEEKWETKGSVISADGMMYLYEERRGNVGLVMPTPDGFELISSFRQTDGNGPHWAHPVISDGRLYIRHGKVLSVYDIANP